MPFKPRLNSTENKTTFYSLCEKKCTNGFTGYNGTHNREFQYPDTPPR